MRSETEPNWQYLPSGNRSIRPLRLPVIETDSDDLLGGTTGNTYSRRGGSSTAASSALEISVSDEAANNGSESDFFVGSDRAGATPIGGTTSV